MIKRLQRSYHVTLAFNKDTPLLPPPPPPPHPDSLQKSVEVRGWIKSVRPASSSCLFMTLSDCIDQLQLVVTRDKCLHNFNQLALLTVESVVTASGLLTPRPEHSKRTHTRHGDVELQVAKMDIVSKAQQPLPIVFKDQLVPDEDKRLEFRYLDLRRPEMQRNIRFRSAVIHTMRQVLQALDFVDIETPLLFKSTPEGAKEFIVQTEGGKGCYALPQSPQQFKQLLVISGFQRYYQVAKCFRNEDLRADRQPEFTQLDLEMGFAGQHDVIATIEALIQKVWKQHLNLTPNFHSITYDDALGKYGTDKPLFLHKWCIATECFDASTITESFTVSMPSYPHSPSHSPSCSFDHKQLCSLFHALQVDGTLSRDAIQTRDDEDGKHHVKFVVTRSRFAHVGCTLLGRVRMAFLSSLNLPPNLVDFVWVKEFPLFRRQQSSNNQLESMHHPFTAPLATHIDLLKGDNVLLVRAQHYDLVLNGVEIGGGSVRIHDFALQQEIMQRHLGLTADKMALFKHLLDALKCGAPPHAGIALGLDRLVSLMLGTASIRDVIAFPKSSSGVDYLFKTPS